MPHWADILSEARIHEYSNRSQESSETPAISPDALPSFNQQLLQEIVDILTSPNASKADLKRASMLQIQLLSSLERDGLHLLAQSVSKDLAALKNYIATKSH